ncbi:MAG: hypothetical protein K6T59_02735 [Bryobacteraceae bacterium]|nr:hypothetical protein [Bryobacteraceae bacterium]
MSHEKRYLAWKRHHRRRKAAKAKVKLYEEGKLPYEQLPALAREFLRRKRRMTFRTPSA